VQDGFGRRRLLALAATGAGAVVLAACRNDDDAASSTSSGETRRSTTAAGTCETIPEETAGPYPGDGSNGPNILTESGVVRSDITTSIGTASGVAEGVPLTVLLTVTDTAAGCVPMAGAAVYLWHCDREGRYSMYSAGAENENYLRGVQETDADGNVTFVTIFPACYSGRWPHIHFEVYASLDDAISAGDPITTSQLAFPQDTCDVVYATEGYEQSVRNLSQLSLESDMVFSDGVDQQVATMAGDATAGYTATLTVPLVV
jgi:protocatechuate 3,4-dioxygenase beta subunit